MNPAQSYDENTQKDSQLDARDTGVNPEDQYPSRGQEERDLDNLSPFTDRDHRFLANARRNYLNSTTYMETSILPTWQDSLHHFRGEHRAGSKYNGKAYRSRSSIFRPKTRASIKNHEAAFAAAMFTNNDLIDVTAQNQNDPVREAAARIIKRIVQHRLSHGMNWLLTALGAWQDTHNYGVCISRQEWEYEEWEDVEYDLAYDENNDMLTDEEGTPLGTERRVRRIIKDEPVIALIAPENFRFNVGANWADPVRTSNFIIEEIPMLAADVLNQMEKIDPKSGEPVWQPYNLAQVLAAGTYASAEATEAVRQARAGQERQAEDESHSGDESSIVWVHLNLEQEHGQDYVFWTLGSQLMLTKPEPLESVYPLGRPWRMGVSNIETHRVYPASSSEQGSSLQEAINDITNQRTDNVQLALNKRYFIKRQKQGGIDLQALMRNVPGGGVMVDDPNTDVKVIETQDVTSSSYTEQDRLSVEMDELLGNFSQGSVMNNRKLNETVGGMNIMSSGANAIQELSIRIFIETWVLPVIRDVTGLVQRYENDETIMALAADQANVIQEYREQAMTDDMLRQDLLVSINVGMGHTNPAQKVEKMSLALNTVMGLPSAQGRLREDEIIKEVFSYVGYADGNRFVKPMEEMEPDAPDPMLEIKQQELEIRKSEIALREKEMAANQEYRMAEMQQKRDLALAELASKKDIEVARIQADLAKDARKDQTVRDMAAARESNNSRAIEAKEQSGNIAGG